MTKRDFYEAIVNAESAIEVTDEMREVAVKAIASLDKANDYKRTYESKAKVETAERAEQVYSAMVELGVPSTCTAIGEKCGFSHSRVSALCKKLGDRVVKTYSPKGVALWAVAE